MNIKYLKAAFAGLVLSISSFANAGLITVVFDITNYNDEIGSFSGTDLNNDSILDWSELTSFDWTSNSHNHNVDLNDLSGFGDFNLSTNMWIANGISWVNSSDNAYFSWNNRANSISGAWAEVTIVSPTQVPEPSTVAIFGLALIGLAFRQYKK